MNALSPPQTRPLTRPARKAGGGRTLTLEIVGNTRDYTAQTSDVRLATSPPYPRPCPASHSPITRSGGWRREAGTGAWLPLIFKHLYDYEFIDSVHCF